MSAPAPDSFVRDIFAWLDQVCADPAVKPSAFKLAYVLARHLNRKQRRAWPSHSALMASTSFTRPTVQRSLYELAKRGHLKIESGKGRHVVSRYVLVDAALNASPEMPFPADDAAGDDAETASSVMPFADENASVTKPLSYGKGIMGERKRHHGRCTEPFEEPFEEDSLPPAEQGGAKAAQQSVMLLPIAGGRKSGKHEYPPEFEQVWTAFGQCRGFNRNMTKAETFRAWLSLKTDRPPTPILVACVDAYARDLAANEWRQMKYPAGWLRARKWEGFLPTAANKSVQAGPDERLEAAKVSYGQFAARIIAELSKRNGGRQDKADAVFREWFGKAQFIEGPPHRIVAQAEFVANWISREFPWLEKLLGDEVIIEPQRTNAKVA